MQPPQNPKTDNVPTHLGFILDGNRRWAKSRGLHSLKGHEKGYQNFKKIAELAINKGVKYVSAYVFSTENWKRSEEEVSYLMNLLHKVATTEIDEVHDKGIRVRFLGSKERLSPKIVEAIEQAEIKTAHNTKGTIAFCLNYGGHLEITEAVKAMIDDNLSSQDITEEKIASYLYAPDIPEVDMVVRTSGEQRISNFMLWRIAYAELLFVDMHWPDFDEADLDSVIEEFANRQRRFGS